MFLGLFFTLAMQIAKADSTWVYTVQITSSVQRYLLRRSRSPGRRISTAQILHRLPQRTGGHFLGARNNLKRSYHDLCRQ